MLEFLGDIWHWHPPVGVWIGVLGLLGVVVPLFRDISKIGKPEKAVWTFVLFALLLLEIKTVYQDRNEDDAEQAECGGPGCSDSFRRFLSGGSVFRFRLPGVLADG
jgi:hypothetical protein